MKNFRLHLVILALLVTVGSPAVRPTRGQTPTLKFDFGPGKVAHGYRQVIETTTYTKERGYGFEPGASVSCVDRGGEDALRGDFCTSDKPYYFSVALPEGNYHVTVILGDAQGESTTTIKAELRRLMLQGVHTARGEFATRTFTVNIRTSKIAGDGEVKLKDREKTTEVWAWDEKLTLEFNDRRPAVCALEITRTNNLPTIYLLGDSTVCDQPREPYASWGQMLTGFFGPAVVIANNAESGESLRSSLGAKRLDKVLSTMKPGDYLFIQFAHNDEKERGEGVGAFTTYKADLKRFVAEARKLGGIPVLVTPMHRRAFDAQGKITNSHGDYPEAVRQTAKEENVPLIDLNAMSKDLFEALGPQGTLKAFVHYPAGTFPDQPKELKDDTHFNSYGAYELAKCIVEGVKAAKLGITKYLVKDLWHFDPKHPDRPEDLKLLPSPLSAGVKPQSN